MPKPATAAKAAMEGKIMIVQALLLLIDLYVAVMGGLAGGFKGGSLINLMGNFVGNFAGNFTGSFVGSFRELLLKGKAQYG